MSGKEQLFKSLRGERQGNGRKNQKSRLSLIKRDQPHEQGVDRGRTEETKRMAHVPEKEGGANHFSGGFTALGLYMCVCVCARAREFEQLNHRNFISVRRLGNITVRSVVVARDFGSSAALRISSIPRPQTTLRNLREAASLIGREESSIDITSAIGGEKKRFQSLLVNFNKRLIGLPRISRCDVTQSALFL